MAAEKGAAATTFFRESERVLVVTRRFAAPARLVFDAWTKPELVARWWAPRSHGSMVACEADVRAGGKYRYVMRAGTREIAFSGEYREVTPHSRLVYTQVFEPMAEAGMVVVTIGFVEHAGQTTLTQHALYPSAQALEATLSTGMEHGAREAMEQLAAVVQTLG